MTDQAASEGMSVRAAAACQAADIFIEDGVRRGMDCPSIASMLQEVAAVLDDPESRRAIGKMAREVTDRASQGAQFDTAAMDALRAGCEPGLTQPICTVCKHKVAVFTGHHGFRHYRRGSGTAAFAVELYDPGHSADVAWDIPVDLIIDAVIGPPTADA